MANSHPSASEITAGLTKSLLLLLAIFFLLPGFLFSQKDGDALSEKERRKFNEIFFQAEKEKNIGNNDKARDYYLDLYKMSPSNATVCYELSQIYAQSNDGQEAIFYAERAASLEPENKWYQILLVSVYRSFGESEKEITTLQSLVRLDSVNPDYHYELAQAYLNNDQPQKALDELNDLEEITGLNETLSNQKKQIYLQLGNLEGAVNEIKGLIAAYPRQIENYGTLAQLYMANGESSKALEIYHQMQKIAPDDPRPELDLARYYQDQKDFEKSILHLKKAMQSPDLEVDKKVAVLLSLFDASANDSLLKAETFVMLDTLVRQNPNDPKAFAIYGDFLSRDKENVAALKMYKKAVRLEGGSLYDIWNQILLIEIQTEMYDSLIKDGPEAVDLFPNHPLPYFFTGVAYNMKDKPEMAVDFLEGGLTYVMGNPRLKEQFYTQLADAYHMMGENTSSDSYFDKALALNGNNPTVLNNYAYYLAERGQQLDKALEMTEKSNALSTNNEVFLDTWAWVLYKKGDYAKALEKMERVAELGGDKSGEVKEHYGDILYMNGKTAEALEQWKKAKTAGGASPKIDQKIREGKIVE